MVQVQHHHLYVFFWTLLELTAVSLKKWWKIWSNKLVRNNVRKNFRKPKTCYWIQQSYSSPKWTKKLWFFTTENSSLCFILHEVKKTEPKSLSAYIPPNCTAAFFVFSINLKCIIWVLRRLTCTVRFLPTKIRSHFSYIPQGNARFLDAASIVLNFIWQQMIITSKMKNHVPEGTL